MKTRTLSTVGAFDAKTRLSELLDRVEQGETIVITRHGVPVARLVAFEQSVDAQQVQSVLDRLSAIGNEVRAAGQGMTVAEIREAIGEGRR
ncbi:MAG: type II toxin-antitoxin system prevent-host-death family antitoxin [Planctomycetes bacterium]|nr:type II toxin-antitoxin system prevent-host-death family antitoxin [Planctomycetota bacterium]